MRELSVCYCPKCGCYGYIQRVRNASCPTCGLKMNLLNIRYQDFVRLAPKERDLLIIHELLSKSSCVTPSISAAERTHNPRKLIAAMNTHIEKLSADNRQLSETIEWMHRTIWDLMSQNRDLKRTLSKTDSD